MSVVSEGYTLHPVHSGIRVLSCQRLIYAVLLFFTAAASFNGYYSKTGFLEKDPHRSFEAIINGTCIRPYIYRRLVPILANWADRVTPQSLKARLQNVKGVTGIGIYDSLFPSSPTAHNPIYSFRYLVFYMVDLAFAELAIFLLYLVCRSCGYAPHISVAASCLLILLIPYLQIRGGGMFSDYPELAFLALGVLIARRFHWAWLLPVAFLGTLNKETYLLILLTLWPILRERYGNLRATLQVLLTLAVGTPLYLAERYYFRGNPGNNMDNQFAREISYWVHPNIWFLKIGYVYGVFLPEMFTLIPLALLIWVVWRGWKGLPQYIRQHGIVGFCIMAPLFLAFGEPGETRDWCLLFGFLMLIFASNLAAVDLASPGTSPSTSLESKL